MVNIFINLNQSQTAHILTLAKNKMRGIKLNSMQSPATLQDWFKFINILTIIMQRHYLSTNK